MKSERRGEKREGIKLIHRISEEGRGGENREGREDEEWGRGERGEREEREGERERAEKSMYFLGQGKNQCKIIIARSMQIVLHFIPILMKVNIPERNT